MNTLSGILNECGLVCPYDDELVCQLDDVCHKFVESVDLTESEFADWVKCYCEGDYSIKIRTFVEKWHMIMNSEHQAFLIVYGMP